MSGLLGALILASIVKKNKKYKIAILFCMLASTATMGGFYYILE
jgi:hypothetical protein